MTTYKVTARRWELGWELHIDGIGVTQVATLASAGRLIRDYVAALTGTDPGEIIVDYQIELAAVLDVSPQRVSQLLNP